MTTKARSMAESQGYGIPTICVGDSLCCLLARNFMLHFKEDKEFPPQLDQKVENECEREMKIRKKLAKWIENCVGYS